MTTARRRMGPNCTEPSLPVHWLPFSITYTVCTQSTKNMQEPS